MGTLYLQEDHQGDRDRLSLRRPSFPRDSSPLEGGEKVLKQVQRAHGDLRSRDTAAGVGKKRAAVSPSPSSLPVTGTEHEKNPCGH